MNGRPLFTGSLGEQLNAALEAGTAGVTFAEPADDTRQDTTCANCPDEVIRNYDGLGTGWSHVWPEGHQLYLSSGTKQCRPEPVRVDIEPKPSPRFVLVCLECWKPMPGYDALHVDCSTCPHCGNHKHGARQQQLDAPCTDGKEDS